MTGNTRDPCAVADGYGITITVQRGHLTISDGLGRHRRTRSWPRIDRDLRRILILGHTGSISLEALRWCHERQIVIAQLDADNALITLSAIPGPDDARIRRAQALAPFTDTGLDIARTLLAAKVAGQAATARTALDSTQLADTIDSYRQRIEVAGSIEQCRDFESHAANAYFGGWARSVGIRFASRDHDLVPEHWHTFGARRSPLMRGRTPRVAATPINALLNYLYALAEVESRAALITVGLDPGLGVIHVDAKARDSLALDLLEVARPAVDRYVLDLLSTRNFRAADFVETRDGQCRLMPALAEDLAPMTVLWASGVAPYAERIADLLGESTSRRQRSTPLTRSNSAAAQRIAAPRQARVPRAAAMAPAALASTCRVCGIELGERRRKLCPACWPGERAELARHRAALGREAQRSRRSNGDDPSNAERARAARAASLSARRREQLAWDQTAQPVNVDFKGEILPGLANVPLARITAATGLSVSACSRIRSGTLTPHARHWPVLAELSRK